MIFLRIGFIYFLFVTSFLYAGQVGPKGKVAKEIITALRYKNIPVLEKYFISDHGVSFTYGKYPPIKWEMSEGMLINSGLLELLYDKKTYLDTFGYPGSSPGPHKTWSEMLIDDFYLAEVFSRTKEEDFYKIFKKKYYTGAIMIYSGKYLYQINLRCENKRSCFIVGFETMHGDENLFWTKACSTDKDMYGRPMKKTECPDH